MKNFWILFILSYLISPVYAGGLMDLYSDTSNSKQTTTKQVTNTDNNSYIPVTNTSTTNSDDIVKKGSKNYGSYANKDFRTNPVRINNPYNTLNDKKMSGVGETATSYSGKAVTFKKGKDGMLYGYNKYGQKVGVYKINSNGTTTQYDMKGKKTGVFK